MSGLDPLKSQELSQNYRAFKKPQTKKQDPSVEKLKGLIDKRFDGGGNFSSKDYQVGETILFLRAFSKLQSKQNKLWISEDKKGLAGRAISSVKLNGISKKIKILEQTHENFQKTVSAQGQGDGNTISESIRSALTEIKDGSTRTPLLNAIDLARAKEMDLLMDSGVAPTMDDLEEAIKSELYLPLLPILTRLEFTDDDTKRLNDFIYENVDVIEEHFILQLIQCGAPVDDRTVGIFSRYQQAKFPDLLDDRLDRAVDDRRTWGPTPLLRLLNKAAHSSNGQKEAYLSQAKDLLDSACMMERKDQSGKNALMHAVAAGHDEIAQLLMEKGANPDATDNDGKTALMHAVATGHSKSAEALMKMDAKPHATDNDGKTALMHAVAAGHDEIAQLLMEKGAKLDATDDSGKTALMHAVATGHSKSAEALMKMGAKPDATDDNGKTALMHAVAAGDSDSAEALMKMGAEPDARDKDGKTALMHAVATEQHGVLRTLLDNGSKLHGTNNSDLIIKLIKNNFSFKTEEIESFFKEGLDPYSLVSVDAGHYKSNVLERYSIPEPPHQYDLMLIAGLSQDLPLSERDRANLNLVLQHIIDREPYIGTPRAGPSCNQFYEQLEKKLRNILSELYGNRSPESQESSAPTIDTEILEPFIKDLAFSGAFCAVQWKDQIDNHFAMHRQRALVAENASQELETVSDKILSLLAENRRGLLETLATDWIMKFTVGQSLHVHVPSAILYLIGEEYGIPGSKEVAAPDVYLIKSKGVGNEEEVRNFLKDQFHLYYNSEKITSLIKGMIQGNDKSSPISRDELYNWLKDHVPEDKKLSKADAKAALQTQFKGTTIAITEDLIRAEQNEAFMSQFLDEDYQYNDEKISMEVLKSIEVLSPLGSPGAD